MYSIGFNLSAIPKGHDLTKHLLATEVTEFFGSSLHDVGWALPTITHVGQCPTYVLPLAMAEKICNQNLFFSVYSGLRSTSPTQAVTTVANNKVSRYSAKSNLNQFK